MSNTKTFNITTEFKINRAVWRTMGYGDQPSKREVTEMVHKFLKERSSFGTVINLSVRYMGAPGHYRVIATFTVNQPWYRRAGLGDSTSLKEVKLQVQDFIHEVASESYVNVVGV